VVKTSSYLHQIPAVPIRSIAMLWPHRQKPSPHFLDTHRCRHSMDSHNCWTCNSSRAQYHSDGEWWSSHQFHEVHSKSTKYTYINELVEWQAQCNANTFNTYRLLYQIHATRFGQLLLPMILNRLHRIPFERIPSIEEHEDGYQH